MNTQTMKMKAHTERSMTISAFFTERQQIESVLSACLALGIPRDLIDVAVSEKAALKFNQLKANRNTDHWFAWTGRGALAGLLISIAISLGMVLIKGYEISNQMALIQLLGPDLGIIIGAAFGALYGWLRESDNNKLMQRAETRDDAMLLLVYLQPTTEVEKIRSIMEDARGQAIVIEDTSTN